MIESDKIKEIRRLAKEINSLAHFYPNWSKEVKLNLMDKISGRIIMICEDLEEKING